MTATRQFVAQNHQWSLDELELTASISSEGVQVSEDSFLVTGMSVEGAEWHHGSQLTHSNKINVALKPVLFTWCKVEKKQIGQSEIMLPVYLNKTRKNIIFSIKVTKNIDKVLAQVEIREFLSRLQLIIFILYISSDAETCPSRCCIRMPSRSLHGTSDERERERDRIGVAWRRGVQSLGH